MASINTGELKSAKDTPKDRWRQLVNQWQRCSAIEFPDDCSKLRQMKEEAEELEMWEALGYSDIAEFFSDGLLLDYRAVELACLALDAYEGGMSYGEAQEKGRKLAKHGAQPGNDNAKKDRDKNEPTVKGSYGGNQDYLRARMDRDFPGVDVDSFPSVRQAAIACGIVKVPTCYEVLVRAWNKASEEERQQFRSDYL